MSEGVPPVARDVPAEDDAKGHGQAVAKHYNELQECGREIRTESRIYYMRNFNNWIKSVAINETMQRLVRERGRSGRISVLDLCSGKGGDLLKWKKGGISHLVCADIAQTSVEQSEVRYKDMVDRERFKDRVFTAEFITADCSKSRLRDQYKDPSTKFDICSCQFSFHYCFESLPQADCMLRNAVECLSLGGYFIGTTPNAQEIVRRLRDSDDMSFGNDVYRVTFEADSKDTFPLFGARYNFHLEGVVDCPEFLVFFPVLEKMAEKYGMKLVFKTPFADFFNQYVEDKNYRSLLGRMQALEMYPPDRGSKLSGDPDTDYVHVKSVVDGSQDSTQSGDRGHRRTVGTLSKAEWDAVTIYCVFLFQKVKDMETGEEWVSTETPQSGPEKRTSSEPATLSTPPKVVKYS